MRQNDLRSIDHEDAIGRLNGWLSETCAAANFSSTWTSSDLKKVYLSALPNIVDIRFGEVIFIIVPGLWFQTKYVNQSSVCRDVIMLRKIMLRKIMLRKNARIDVKESSSNRYPYLSGYPEEIYLRTYNKFRSYFNEQLHNFEILKNDNYDKLISDYVLESMKRLGFYGQPMYYKWMRDHKISPGIKVMYI